MKNFFKEHSIDISLTGGSIFIVCFLHWFGVFDYSELKTYDYRFHSVRGPLTGWRAADSTIIDIGTDVVMVDVDDEAWRLLQEKKVPWPYPRGDIWARVIDNLTMAGAKVIAFDIQFDSPMILNTRSDAFSIDVSGTKIRTTSPGIFAPLILNAEVAQSIFK